MVRNTQMYRPTQKATEKHNAFIMDADFPVCTGTARVHPNQLLAFYLLFVSYFYKKLVNGLY